MVNLLGKSVILVVIIGIQTLNEVKFRNVPLDYVKNTIIEVANPQQLSDKDINIL